VLQRRKLLRYPELPVANLHKTSVASDWCARHGMGVHMLRQSLGALRLVVITCSFGPQHQQRSKTHRNCMSNKLGIRECLIPITDSTYEFRQNHIASAMCNLLRSLSWSAAAFAF
jgi:hypothetical protein